MKTKHIQKNIILIMLATVVSFSALAQNKEHKVTNFISTSTAIAGGLTILITPAAPVALITGGALILTSVLTNKALGQRDAQSNSYLLVAYKPNNKNAFKKLRRKEIKFYARQQMNNW